MRFCIVSPATVTEFNRDEAQTAAVRRLAEHAPVGVLTLAAVLEEKGQASDIVDLNELYRDYLCADPHQSAQTDFCRYAAERILEVPFDTIGFGTICSTFPLTLRIADVVRRARPDVAIMLGGPQASAVDLVTLKNFPQIDFVLRYEAEESLPRLLSALEHGEPIETVQGLTYRRAGQSIRTESAPPIEDLDRLPLPAYHRYPYLRQAHYLPLELGRGCPYACTFCSTNDFFRRDFRLKTPKLIVEQMRALKKEYNVPIFDLIHDMFTVNRKKVLEFCDEIIASGEEFSWNCSARTDRVDPELLERMEEAGCRGIFFGIETGSQTLQRVLKKRLVLSDAIKKVEHASRLGFQTAVSLITGFPTESNEDFADTVDFFARALRYENTSPQLHILAPLADTPIEREYRDRLHFDDIISDMSHQGWEQDPADRALIAGNPQVFANFYAVPTPLDRRFIKEVRAFLLHGARNFRWLMAALHRERGHLLTVYRDFRAWLGVRQSGFALSGADLTGYYRRAEFCRDFPEFIRDTYVSALGGSSALGALLEFSTAFTDVTVENPMEDLKNQTVGDNGRVTRRAFSPRSVPIRAGNVRLMKSEFDFVALMDAIIAGESLADIPRRPGILASRKRPGQWPQVLQLSPSALTLLELCDGCRPVAEIAAAYAAMSPRSDDIPPEKAAIIGLELLRYDELIGELPADDVKALEAA
jgi:radical SAM superfamily enzyme YgiQ (UPF0313 family)